MFVTNAVAAMRWTTPKKSTIRVQLLLELPGMTVTTAARNQETFVAQRESAHGPRQLIKLSYEYLYYEPLLIQQPLNQQMIYKLRVVRDHACDESLGAIGRELGLNEPSVVHTIGNAGTDGPLACYRTTPSDYLSVHAGKGTTSAVQ